MHYCFQEKETAALLFSGEGIWCSTSQLFLGEGNWCITVIKDEETGALLLMFSEEGNWCCTVLGKRSRGCTVLRSKEVVLYQVYLLTMLKVGN